MRDNRRRGLRADTDFSVKLKEIVHNRLPQIQNMLTRNVSETGLQLSSFNFYPVNTRLVMEASLSNKSEPVAVVGRVVWIEQLPYQERFKMGVEFSEMSEDARMQFQNTIQSFVSKKQKNAAFYN